MKFVLLGNLTVSVHSCNRICHDQSDECNIIIFIHITSVCVRVIKYAMTKVMSAISLYSYTSQVSNSTM
jgi:hypothetical protein